MESKIAVSNRLRQFSSVQLVQYERALRLLWIQPGQTLVIRLSLKKLN